jgi:hypothetical protein
MFCKLCNDHHPPVETTTLKQFKIVLSFKMHWRDRYTIYRNIRNAHKKLDTRLWDQDVVQWVGEATIYGETRKVWGWAHKGLTPLVWEDIPE